MCGDRQNGFGLGRCLPYATPCFCVAIVQDGIHRIAVTKKDCGKYLGHVEAPLFGSRYRCGILRGRPSAFNHIRSAASDTEPTVSLLRTRLRGCVMPLVYESAAVDSTNSNLRPEIVATLVTGLTHG